MMVVTAVIGVSIAGIKYLHDEVVVPRTPIVWGTCTVEDLRQEPQKRRLLVVSSGKTMSHFYLLADLDTPSLRTLAWRNSVACSCILPNDEIFSYLESRKVEPFWVSQIVVVTDGERIASYRFTGEKEDALNQDIHEFFKGEQ
jgi:hypothetical protein